MPNEVVRPWGSSRFCGSNLKFDEILRSSRLTCSGTSPTTVDTSKVGFYFGGRDGKSAADAAACLDSAERVVFIAGGLLEESLGLRLRIGPVPWPLLYRTWWRRFLLLDLRALEVALELFDLPLEGFVLHLKHLRLLTHALDFKRLALHPGAEQ